MPVGACSFQPSLCWELAWPWDDLPFSEPQLPVWFRTQPELGPSSSIHSVEGREKHVNSLQRALQLPTQDRDYAPKAAPVSEERRREGRRTNPGDGVLQGRTPDVDSNRSGKSRWGTRASIATLTIGRHWALGLDAGQSLGSVGKEQSK